MRTAALVSLLLLAASPLASAWEPPLPFSLLHPPRSTHARSHARSVAAQARWRRAAPPSGVRTYNPADFGGDPSGQTDSTAAVSAAVAALLSEARASGVLDGGDQHDAGGAAVDLAGGVFLIAAPLVIPAGYANLRITSGTLRAAPSFPRSRYLIEVGNTTSEGGNIDIGMSALFLDAWQVAAGCILTNGGKGAVIGPQIYAFNFTTVGINVVKGFETTITESWAAEYSFADPRKENGTASVATGIFKNGNDGAITDVIVFSSRVGIEVGGEANILENLHTWSLANNNGGTGILVTVGQARLVSCYLVSSIARSGAPPPHNRDRRVHASPTRARARRPLPPSAARRTGRMSSSPRRSASPSSAASSSAARASASSRRRAAAPLMASTLRTISSYPRTATSQAMTRCRRMASSRAPRM